MKYLFIIMLMAFCGCNILPIDNVVISQKEDCFANVHFSQAGDQLVLLMTVYAYHYTIQEEMDFDRIGSDFLFVSPIDIIQGEPFEWSVLDKGKQNGTIVRGFANTDVDDVRINCTLNILKNGRTKGFQDQSFELNSIQRIPLLNLSSQPVKTLSKEVL